MWLWSLPFTFVVRLGMLLLIISSRLLFPTRFLTTLEILFKSSTFLSWNRYATELSDLNSLVCGLYRWFQNLMEIPKWPILINYLKLILLLSSFNMWRMKIDVYICLYCLSNLFYKSKDNKIVAAGFCILLSAADKTDHGWN